MKTRKLSGIAFPLWALLLLLVPLGAVENNPQGVTDNPFFQEYKTPFDTPPFDRIKNEHFLPAMKEGIRLHELEIKAITDNPQTPTFANTLAALDGSGKFLERVSRSSGLAGGQHDPGTSADRSGELPPSERPLFECPAGRETLRPHQERLR